MSIKKPVNKIEKLIDELCPDGVEFKKLGEVCEKTSNIKWQNNKNKQLQYIDLTSVDRNRNIITETKTITSETAPSRAQKIVKAGDVIFGTTRPTLKRFCVINHEYNEQICSTGFCVLRPKIEIVLTNYIFHFISSSDFYTYTESNQKGASYPAISDSAVKKIKIPIPPLAIQKEIVKTLHNFTELEAELEAEIEAELEARKNQYEYYRGELLAFDPSACDAQVDDEVKWKTLGEVAGYRRGSFPQPYGESRWYDGESAMPFVQVADVGENMRLIENTKRKISKLAQPKSVFVPVGTVIVTLQGSIGRVAITQYDSYVDRTLAIFERFKIEINKKYFAYQLESKFGIEKENARGSTIKTITKEEFTQYKIPIPSLAEQKRIVSILDKFDAIVIDISIGLPAEITARKKQYEYYRNQLLTFKEKQDAN
jgi:type I restriction enzyme S subunit